MRSSFSFRRKTDARYRVVQFSTVFATSASWGAFLQALFRMRPKRSLQGRSSWRCLIFELDGGRRSSDGRKKHIEDAGAFSDRRAFRSLPLFLLLKRLAELFEAGTYAQALTTAVFLICSGMQSRRSQPIVLGITCRK
ncbi:MAG: hypothetical protein ACLRSW_05590 [Christensenellaceae bacterium]